MTSSRSLLSAVLLAITLLAPAGCLVVEARLDERGGGTLKMKVAMLDDSGDQRMRREVSSPSVKLESAAFADGVGTYEVSFTDAGKLRTAALFRNLRIEHEGMDGSSRKLSLTIPRRERKKHEIDLPPDDYVVMDLSLTLPGTIVETDGEKVSDSQVRWKLTIADLLGDGAHTVHVAYDVAAAAAPAAAN